MHAADLFYKIFMATINYVPYKDIFFHCHSISP